MRLERPRLWGADLAVAMAGAAATLLVAYFTVKAGTEISLGLLFGVAFFVFTVIGFVSYPHIAVAVMIPLFALIPMLKVFVSPDVGALKDLMVVAATTAGVILYVFERRWVDRRTLVLVALLLALYAVNVGSGHDIAWAHGVRLAAEPLLLLLVGMLLPNPRKTFRWALGALIATCVLVAGYGLFQQVVGKYTLVEWGYSFEAQVRSLANGQLRSFGTLDDSFAYAALLVFGIAALLFGPKRGALTWTLVLVLLGGLAVGFVRTSLLMLGAFVGLMIRRMGYNATAVLVVGATAVVGIVALVNAGGSQSQTIAIAGSGSGTSAAANVILNGRISAWEAALGPDPVDWVLGRGVGQVGTAASRAGYEIAPSTDETVAQAEAVDSGYLALIADVGIGGLLVMLAIFWRLGRLAIPAAARGLDTGWVALALLAALLIDGLTRASFTGFPTAFLCLMLIGISLSAAQRELAEQDPRAQPG